jgi:hypothetical protein
MNGVGVVDRQARSHDAAEQIDIHRDFFFRVVGLDKQELGHHQRGYARGNTAPRRSAPTLPLQGRVKENYSAATACTGSSAASTGPRRSPNSQVCSRSR